MSILHTVRCTLMYVLAILALTLATTSVGCKSLEPDENFDDAEFGEFGQSLREPDADSAGKWGVHSKSRQIEENLGL